MENTITFTMLEHHKSINALLDKLMDGFGMDRTEIYEHWEMFKEKMESHMQAEERAIFSYEKIGDMETQKIIRDLLLEHKQIRETILNIDQDFELNFGMNIIDLQRLLLEHESKENEVLYPKLDKLTSDEEKISIISKIK